MSDLRTVLEVNRTVALRGVIATRNQRIAALEAENAELHEDVAVIEAQNDRLMRHLESMTPGGSEFHNDPGRCVLWITQRNSSVIHQIELRKAAEAEVKRLREQIKLLTFQLDTLRRHPEFHNLDVLVQKGDGE